MDETPKHTRKEHAVFELITNENPRRELAHRANDGIEVTLLWSEATDTVAVEVYDRGADNLFEFPVARDRALDAFHHPYVYAYEHGLEPELPVLKAA